MIVCSSQPSETPLTVKPSIYLDSIYNSVFDGTVAPTTANAVPVGPLTTPSVIFSINGVVQNFSVVSVTQFAAPPNYVIASQGGTVNGWILHCEAKGARA